MIKKARLFTPGPTALHPDVQLALGRPIVHHRTDEFRALLKECIAGLKEFFRTQDDVLVLASSGTGAMEAAVTNLLSPGDKMLALVAGNFGERWEKIGKAYGMNVTSLTAQWGEAVSPAEVAQALDRDPEIKAVFCQLSESSTGACHDVKALAEITRKRPNTLLVVDAISGAGAMQLETAEWAPGSASRRRRRHASTLTSSARESRRPVARPASHLRSRTSWRSRQRSTSWRVSAA